MVKAVASRTFAEYLTIGQAAEFLGVSPWTLRNWDASAKLKSARHPISGYRIYRREELQALLDSDSLSTSRGRSLTPNLDWNEIGDREHFVQFFENDNYLVESVSAYVERAIAAGDAAIVIATTAHRASIHRKLNQRGTDLSAARKKGQYVALSAAETLSALMTGDSPDAARFEESVGAVIRHAAAHWPRVRAFGEMVALLWDAGNARGACELEALWNDLAKRQAFSLFCAYPMKAFDRESGASFSDVCGCHTRVIPAESYLDVSAPADQLRVIANLQQKAHRLEAEIARRVEAERDLSDFLEHAVEGIHKVGPDGILIWANQAELALIGYEPDEYIGHHVSEFHVDHNVIADMLNRLLNGENLINQPARLRCKDGSVKHVLISSNGQFKDGEFVYSRCFTRDVTQIRQADRDRAMLAAIVQSSQDAIISKTFDGIIRSWNAGAQRLFGYTESEAVGQPITLLIPKDRLDEETHIIRCLRRGERIEHFETIRLAKDGTPIDISLTISPLRDDYGNLIGASKIARDIRDRKRAEEVLKKEDRRKDEFIATLAHELRNPLAPIRNGLHILRMAGQNGVAADGIHEMMERQVGHLVHLVDDLLEVSRISRGKIELRKQPIDIAMVIRQALETSKPLIDAGGHALELRLPDHPVIIEGDQVRLSQIFSNLLNNAAKYTNPGGAITISAGRQDGQVTVSIRDTGIGIPPEMLGEIFEMFAQVNNPLRRNQDGLGIGLSLVRSLVLMHGGVVEARSDGIGRGSEFIVRLPSADAYAPENANSQSLADAIPQSRQASRRILVVDDNKDSADSMAKVLRFLSYDVQIAYDGAAAIEVLKRFRPAVVLMDIGMPNMDGCEVARQIRLDPCNREMLLIALTGWGQEQDRRRSEEAGFNHHLVKPLDIDNLVALLTVPETQQPC